MGFPGGSDGKASAYNAVDPGSIPGLGRSPGEGNGNPLQYSCLKIAVDRRPWQATVYGVAKSWTRLSDFTFHFHFHIYKLGLPWCGSVVKNLPANTGDVGSIPVLGKYPREGNGNWHQYSCLGNPMNRRAWRLQTMGSQKSQTWLSD